ISAVGVNNPIVFGNKIIALENESLSLAAAQCDIPVIDLSAPVADVVKQLEKFSIDVMLMSCYNRRIPDALLQSADHGCFNLHPSLLPGSRGPEPVFWQMKHACDMGVSWHQVVHEFDAGDIAIQQKVNIDEGADYSGINHELARVGADLMMNMLSDLSAGTLNKSAQDSALASYYPYPVKDDFVIETSWSAQHAYNFMCATHSFGHPYQCKVGEQNFLLVKALDYDNNTQIDEVEVQGDRLYIPFKEGILCVTYTGKLSI
ncbi:MAG: hypothetical protein IMF17_03205, partial [Proteobacteria bacterium]|nr:hypothetical protein [Pseudomonadota bacterium]